MMGGDDPPVVSDDDLECLATLVVNCPNTYPVAILGSPELDLKPDDRLVPLVEELLDARKDGVDNPDELVDIAKSWLSGGLIGDSPLETEGIDFRDKAATPSDAVDLAGVDPATYPQNLVEYGARWLLWQERDGRKIPRNPRWGYTKDEGYDGWAKAGAKDARMWF